MFAIELLADNEVRIGLSELVGVQDIGIERSHHRSQYVFSGRFAKNILRAKKAKVLEKNDKRARGLFKAGPFPSIKYGYKSVGLSLSARDKVDGLAYQSIMVAGFKPEKLAVLSVDLGFVPSVELVKGQIEWWIRFRISSPP